MSQTELEPDKDKRAGSRPHSLVRLKRGDFYKLLPQDFQLQVRGAEAVAERQQLFQDRSHTFSGALDRISQMKPASPEETVRMGTALVRLARSTDQVLALLPKDPLEEYRIAQGLSARRDELMNRLFGLLSFNRGFQHLNVGLQSVNQEAAYENMLPLNTEHPHITKTEVTLFSLSSHVSDTFIRAGKVLHRRPMTPEELEETLVPMIGGASIYGLLCMDDAQNPNIVSIFDTNPYTRAGITAAPGPIETLPFTEGVQEIIHELIPLILSNYRLHERVWNSTDSLLVDGLGKLDRVALSLIAPEIGQAGKPLAEIMREISREKRACFAEQQRSINQAIGRNIVVNLHKGIPLTAADIVKLIGMLDKVPALLIDQKQPFYGFFTPYGPGVLFTDEKGTPLVYEPYDPYYIREALQGIYYESIDVQKNNNTLALIFNQVARQAEGLVMEEVAETGEDPSILEGIKIDLKFLCGIDIDICPQMTIVTTTDWIIAWRQFGLKEGLEPLVKFGAEEARQILETCRLLPKTMLKDIHKIQKTLKKDFILQELMTGAEVASTYDADTGTITIKQRPEIPYVAFIPEMKAARSFAILHEIGHAIWQRLPLRVKRQYARISWNRDGTKRGTLNDFLTMYSHIRDAEEDFCDHLASYILFSADFRQKLTTSRRLMKKYQLLKNIFSEAAGQPLEYPQITPFTIEQVVGAVNQELKRRTEDEALQLLISADQQRDKESERMALSDVIKRLDEEPDDVVRKDQLETMQEEESGEEAEEARRLTELDDQITFQRNSINTILDHLFPSGLDEEKATEEARRIFDLVREGKTDQALAAGKEYIMDEDVEDFQQELEAIEEDMEQF